MQIQTITGSSIQDALAEARATLGDGVVLLESVAASESEPARITVMLDAARAPRPAAVAASAAVAPNVSSSAAPADDALAPLGHGYAGAARHGRRPLFTTPPAVTAPAPPPVPISAPAPEILDRLDRLDARMASSAALTDRLDRLERRLANALLGGAQPWAAHPLYGRLLQSGLSPTLSAALLSGASDRGLTPDRVGPDDQMALLWSIAQSLRDRLEHTAPRRYTTDTLVVVGPSGSGKTTLLTRLATDSRFYGRRDAGVLVVMPDNPSAADPSAVYRHHGIPVRSVRTPEEVRESLDRFHGTHTLLVDTPALPADDAAARRALCTISDLLTPLTAFDVVLTLDAARARPPLDFERLDTLPLPPTLGAVTRLDETDDWGRVAEWLIAFGRPVGFAATGPGFDEALVPYSPAWFVELFAHRLGL